MIAQLSIPKNALVVKETPSFIGLCFTARTTIQSLSQYAPGVAERLYSEAERLRLNAVGPIQWIYAGVNGDPNHEFQLEIVLPIAQAGASSNEFSYKEFTSFHCATYTYMGSWSAFPTLYDALFDQFYQHGYRNDGDVREVYTVIDLEHPDRCLTEIQIGLM